MKYKVQSTGYKGTGHRALSAFALYAVLCTLYFSLVSCGFHLRGTGKMEMSTALSVLQVRVEDNLLENNPLLVAMKNALRTQTDIQIQESGDASRLVLYDELSDSRVLSVTSAGNVDKYLLIYEVSFRLVDVDGKLLSEPQTVKVQRDHQFDRLNVLAKEREEQELRRDMQRDAAQQILRRLSRVVINPNADERGLPNR